MKLNLFKRQKTTVKQNHEQSITTINDLFARDDLNEFLKEIDDKKAEITNAIICYTTKDSFGCRFTGEMDLTNALGLIERAKFHMIKEADEDD